MNGKSLRIVGHALVIAAALFAAPFAAAQEKKASDVRIVFVTHGQATDTYWSAVKNGMLDGQKIMGSNQYLRPQMCGTWSRWAS